MRIFLPLLVLLFFGFSAYPSSKTDSLLAVLKTELSKRKTYDDQKELRIKNLKKKLAVLSQTEYDKQYGICVKLYDEYKSYQFDSAYVYTQKMLAISIITRNIPRLNESKIKIGFLLLSSGMFKETFECLEKINTSVLSNEAKIDYYSIKSRAYSDLADYNGDKNYAPYDQSQAILYIDSAISLAKPNTFEKLYYMGNKQVVATQMQKPSSYYVDLLTHYKLTDHQRAMVATGLSFFYSGPNQEDDRIFLMTEGAINDIRSSTKETVAIFKLGQQLSYDGNIKDAYTFVQQAMDDALFYGARLRKIQIGTVLPVIAEQININTENEKNYFP